MKSLPHPSLLLALALLASLPAQAYEISRARDASQGQLGDIADDLVAALSFKPLQPSYPAGGWQWDMGFYGSTTFVDEADTWQAATGTRVKTVDTAGISASFKLPYSLQLGVLAAAINNTDDQLYGLDLRYPLLRRMGGLALLSARASASVVYGIEDFHVSTESLELIANHTLPATLGTLTPFASVGVVIGQINPSGDTGLGREYPVQGRIAAGLGWALHGFDIGVEAEQTNRNTGLGLRLSARF